MTTTALINANGHGYVLEYVETDAKTHTHFALTRNTNTPDTTVPSVTSDTLPHHLTVPAITVLDSVNSGTGREHRDFYGNVLKPLFDELNVAHTYIKTQNEHSIAQFAASLDLTHKQTVFVLGGDTSTFELFNNMNKSYEGNVKQDVNICIIPMGSGNAFALTMGFTDEITAIKTLFTTDKVSELPLYQVNFPQGAHLTSSKEPVKSLTFGIVVSFAVHAMIVHYSDDPSLKGLGVERFKVAFGKALQEPMGYQYELSLKTQSGKEEPLGTLKQLSYLCILAAPFMERGYLISPRSNLAKQELHFLSVADIPVQDFAPLMVMPYQQGAHISHPAVQYGPIEELGELRVKINEQDKERAYTCIDGVVVGIDEPMGKTITITNLDTSNLGYHFNFVGLH